MTPTLRATRRDSEFIEVSDYVDRFRTALSLGWKGDSERFLPPQNHPEFREIRREILRLDLIASWQRGQRRGLEHYFSRFPSLVEELDTLRVLAETECNVRRECGEEYDLESRLTELGVPPKPERRSGIEQRDHNATVQIRKTIPVEPEQARTAQVVVELVAPPEEQQTKCVEVPPLQAVPEANEFSEAIPTTNLAPSSSRSRSSPSQTIPNDEFAMAVPDQYRVVRELGRGGCGVVFLAKELELAGREVAIKISRQMHAEPQLLARLHHPNIVPVYSLHATGTYQVMVMPYLGDTTLAHLIKEIQRTGEVPNCGKRVAHFLSWNAYSLRGESATPPSTMPSLAWMESKSYSELVLRFGAELAGGLVHAHERGILHRDIKPANVLLASDGKAMLLDFNIAEDQQSDSTRRVLGGTLTHAAPEQLAAMRTRSGNTDARADVYSLGVILYELFTGKSPFGTIAPNTDWTDDTLYHERLKHPSLATTVRKELSPAISAIIEKCLMPHLEDRYQSAAELREDLLRQISHRPLKHTREPSTRERIKKWWKRNPRLGIGFVSGIVLVTVFVVVSMMVIARQQRLELMEVQQARDRLATAPGEIQALFPSRKIPLTQLEEIRHRSHAVLAPFQLDHRPDWWAQPKLQKLSEADQQQIREQASELMYLAGEAALTAALRASNSDQRAALLLEAKTWSDRLTKTWPDGLRAAHHEQRVRLFTVLGKITEAAELARVTPTVRSLAASPLAIAIQNLRDKGPTDDVIAELKKYSSATPPRCDVWMALGTAYQQRGDFLEAYEAYSGAVALNPESPWPFFHRGVTLLNLQRYPAAEQDFSACLDRHQSEPEVYYNRAIARSQQRKCNDALDDLVEVERQGDPMTRLYFLRADIYRMMGKHEDATFAKQQGMELTPNDPLSYVTRAQYRLRLAPPDVQGATEDLDAALRLAPTSRLALETKGMVLSDRLKQYDQAIPLFQRLLELNPRYSAARGMLGLAYARSGKLAEARRELDTCLAGSLNARENYIVGCGFALLNETADDQRKALQLLKIALRGNLRYGIEMKSDSDLLLIAQNPEFQKNLESALQLESNR